MEQVLETLDEVIERWALASEMGAVKCIVISFVEVKPASDCHNDNGIPKPPRCASRC
jgi:hypothetical protein